MKAATPKYMRAMNQSAPGHRFALYFPVWNDSWKIMKDKKTEAAGEVLSLQPDDKKRMASLAERQQALALSLDDALSSHYAISTAPFVTGMGYEHPLENGFAFLNPYGLPYLPGSSVKGVLRRAAEDMDIDAAVVNELFGSSAADGSQGALNFWDVFPQGQLALDIMTPHYGDYYQGKASPHDSGQPNPIVFLTIAPEARFAFHVEIIRKSGILDWQVMLEQCFDHAFDWLGFGAKTAVGYGAMMRDQDAEEAIKETRAQAAEEARKAAMTPFDREMEEILARDDSFAIGELMKWLESGRLESDDDVHTTARNLKQLLEHNGSWLPEFTGWNKIKKKKHARTLKVMHYLPESDL